MYLFDNDFGKYDLHLKDSNNNNLLTHNAGAKLMYAYKSKYSVNVSFTHSGVTRCSSAVKYAFTDTMLPKVPVYSPKNYESGSSLSHFEDMCYCPAPYSNNNSCNDKYFVMCEFADTGIYKRYLKPEEREVLCNLGYGVNTVYGNVADSTYFNYGGVACSIQTVWGINDGVAAGAYTYSTTTNTLIWLQKSGGVSFMANDTSTADMYEGLEMIYGAGYLTSVTTGNRNSNIAYTPTTEGIHLLRYVPYNSLTGQRGNVTYIYVSVINASCLPATPRNMIRNGIVMMPT